MSVVKEGFFLLFREQRGSLIVAKENVLLDAQKQGVVHNVSFKQT